MPPQAGGGTGGCHLCVPTVLLGEAGTWDLCARAPWPMPGIAQREAGKEHTGESLGNKSLVLLQLLFVVRDFGI